MVDFKLETGRGHLDLGLEDTQNLGVITGQDIPPLEEGQVKKIIGEGMAAHAPNDLGNKKIALIIPDNTRLWARGDLYLPCIVESLLDQGAALENIIVLVALGTHAPMDEETKIQLAGSNFNGKLRIRNSAPLDPNRLVSMGKTSRGTALAFTREAVEADHIIIFGGVLHHPIAGFGGGRKYILPGIAGYETIQENHALAFTPEGAAHPRVRQGQTLGNPVHLDMEEAAKIFLRGKSCTYVALAANGEGNIFHARVGDLTPTFEDACHHLNRACCVNVETKGDFALFSAGGHRTDGQLYQATKALFNAVELVKEGGKLLFVAACDQGVGNDAFARALTQYKTCPKSLGQRLGEEFEMPAYVAFRLMDILNRFQVTLVSNLEKKTVDALGFKTTHDPQGYINGLKGQGYILPFGENILPLVAPKG